MDGRFLNFFMGPMSKLAEMFGLTKTDFLAVVLLILSLLGLLPPTFNWAAWLAENFPVVPVVPVSIGMMFGRDAVRKVQVACDPGYRDKVMAAKKAELAKLQAELGP